MTKGNGILIGMGFGVAIGAGIGFLTHNIGLWMSLGITFGVMVGLFIDKDDDDEGEQFIRRLNL